MQAESGMRSVDLSGLLTVGAIAQAQSVILAALEQHESLSLHIAPESEADVCAVQVLLSARRYAISKSKRIVLTAPASGELLAVLQRGGFLEEMADEDRQFWMHEGGDR